MPTPKEVYDNPLEYLDFFQSADFEGQCFDRKEVRTEHSRQLKTLKENVTKCISAFANSNRAGGLLVLGIADDGTIKGVEHVDETKMNSIIQAKQELKHHATQSQNVDLPDSDGKRLHLLYTPWTPDAICETIEAFPKAWERSNAQCFPLSESYREQLKRDKNIVDFEKAICCPYDPDELDNDVVAEFKKVFIKEKGSYYDLSTKDILAHIGAITKEDGKYYFTNAGYLFFASNPRKRIASAFVRVLRYDVPAEDLKNRGGTTLDKEFDGPLPNIIRNFRTFLNESALFRTFSKRNPDGGFTNEPEYPFIAVDEALVNAIIHREYAVTTPIYCIVYKDKLEVRNPGNIPQQVPRSFTLDNTILDTVPRNPKIVEWMHRLKDKQGKNFVHALSEGTRRMQEEMEKLKLPPPHYQTDQYTTVTLYSKFDERLEKYAVKAVTETEEYANLFQLLQSNAPILHGEFRELRRSILWTIKNALSNHGWFIDSLSFGRIVAHRKGYTLPLSPQVEKIARIYPAYELQVRQYADNLYLCIDYKAELKNILAVDRLLFLDFGIDKLISRHAVGFYDKKWERGRILEINSETTKLDLFDLNTEVNLPNNKVIPSLRNTEIKQILRAQNITHNLDEKIKEHSLLSQRDAAKTRAEKTLQTVQHLADEVFPVKINDLILTLSKIPVPLKPPPPGGYSQNPEPLTVFHEYKEPAVVFHKGNEDTNILDGLAKYSSYSSDPKNVELIPICTPDLRGGMQQLIERLKQGKFKYRGTERTFRTKLTYPAITTASIEEFESECRRLLDENPNWIGNTDLNRLFIVYVPENRYPITDLNSPYYTIKELLLSKGIPVQMVDTPILKNPDWKDFNLALNITAKCGVIPWVLPDELPDTHFFVGLSYTQYRDREIPRIMGFANVFDQYGRWQFYQGNANTFNYDERREYFKELVQSTLERLKLPESPSIHFHYSKKFSTEEKEAILEAAKSVRPNGKYTFVWINNSHIVRFYDPSPQTDGSLHRGTYVIGGRNQFYLSTTGYNTYQKALGTPHPLEVNVWTEPYDPSNPTDLKVIAKHLIYLTKLNWASTRSFCGTPITIKYARDIARFASAFIERSGKFELHKVLEDTPWFI